MPQTEGVPARLVKLVIEEWKGQYGPTFPLYGKETDRHDISGSVIPLLRNTEIPHEKLLSEKSGVSRRAIAKVMNDEVEYVALEVCDRLATAMDRNDVWYVEWNDYR